MKSVTHCPICQSSPVATFTSKIPLKKSTPDIYQLQVETYALGLCNQVEPHEFLSICWNCKSAYRAFFFDSNELQAIYRNEYIEMEAAVPERIVYSNNGFLNENSARTLRLVKNIERTYGVSIRDVFDIGGRDGFRIKSLAESGYNCKVFDPIPCKTCSPLIRKRYITCSEMEEGEKADLIILGSMLEHCENPNAIIKICHEHLREGGFIFIDLPYDIATFFEWVFLRRYIGKSLGIDFTHNVFYSRRAVQYLLAKHGIAVLSSKFNTIAHYEGTVLIEALGRKVGSNDDISKYKKWLSLDFDLLNLRHFWAITYRIIRRITSVWQ